MKRPPLGIAGDECLFYYCRPCSGSFLNGCRTLTFILLLFLPPTLLLCSWVTSNFSLHGSFNLCPSCWTAATDPGNAIGKEGFWKADTWWLRIEAESYQFTSQNSAAGNNNSLASEPDWIQMGLKVKDWITMTIPIYFSSQAIITCSSLWNPSTWFSE